ncbi:MAG: 1,4-dihydroxy-2-naphthoate polyprenyltransferase [Deltaproteobacteria bacterium]|nr:1,4-dihydroxy-2-naphthoate polyprenyltransferase [Deltaproteobacteria bacterium]
MTTPSAAAAWWSAARPRTLTTSIAPVAVGTACAHADGGIAVPAALAALGGAFAIQIGTNFANDVFDAKRGADGPDRRGPPRAVSMGWISARAMLVAMIAAFGVATACGAYLVAIAGWPVVAIGVASVLSGIAYTGGPYPLAYHGLGDVFVLAFFGVVATTGTAFVQRGHVPGLALLASLPIGALATAVLVVNNLRDRDGDAKVGKRTLAVVLGRRGALLEYAALVAASYAILIPVIAARGPWLALPFLTLPLGVVQFRALAAATDGPSFNRCLAATAQLVLVYGLSLALAIVLSS